MTSDFFIGLSSGWPVLLCAGLLLGGITVASARRHAHLMWFLPVLLLAAIAFVLVTGGGDSALILAPDQLGIGVVAVAPAVTVAFLVAWSLLRLGAPRWLLFAGPALACLAGSPLAGFVTVVAVCELTGECL